MNEIDKVDGYNQYKSHVCDLCGHDQPIEIPNCRLYTGNQPIHVCGNCGFVYVRNRRSSEEIARVWSDQIYGDLYTAIKNPAMISRQTFVAEFLAKNVAISGKNICDIGAGEGFFLNYLRDEYKVKPFGIEPSNHNSALLSDQCIPNFEGTAEQFIKSSNGRGYKADIVSIMWTLENCQSCLDMLNVANEILPIGGKLIVATGSRILVPFKKPLFKYFSKNPADSHSFRFSANAIKTALAKTHFKTIHINSYVDNDILCVIAKKVSPEEELKPIKDMPLEVINFFERWHHESVHYLREWS